MTEVTTGVRALLTHPVLYAAFSAIVGGKKARAVLVRDHVRPMSGARILDLGCGPGDLRGYLPADAEYVGVDTSAAYIASAQAHYGGSAEFRVGDAAALDSDLRGFDLVLAIGVLHHLDDVRALELLAGAARALQAGGRMVALDAAITHPQRRLARAVVSRDRGQHVREPHEYLELARQVFANVVLSERTDMLRIPYTHCILECSGPLRSEAPG